METLPRPVFSAIVARARNGVIGVDGGLPWRLSSDLQFFKKTTLGKPVLMGRVTWESLPFPLPGRPNLVLSRQRDYQAKGAETFSNLADMIGRAYELAGQTNVDEIMLIGGAALYAKCMKYLDRLYITDVEVMIEGDAHFPPLNEQDWIPVSQGSEIKGPKDDYPFRINIYERLNQKKNTHR